MRHLKSIKGEIVSKKRSEIEGLSVNQVDQRSKIASNPAETDAEIEGVADKWADVRPEVIRQAMHYDINEDQDRKYYNDDNDNNNNLGDNAALLDQKKKMKVNQSQEGIRLTMPSTNMMKVFKTVAEMQRNGEEIPDLRKVMRRIEQQQDTVPVTRRQNLQFNYGPKRGQGSKTASSSSIIFQREQASRMVQASRARSRAENYQKSDQELLQLLTKPANLGEFTNMVDERIRASRAAGDFKNLPGRGKPLDDDQARPLFVDTTEFMVNKIIKRSGGSVAWVEKDREIKDGIDLFRQTIREAWVRNGRIKDEKWLQDLDVYRKELEKVNKSIRAYNLSTPAMHLHRCLYNFERELEKAYEYQEPLSPLTDQRTFNQFRDEEKPNQTKEKVKFGWVQAVKEFLRI